MLPLVAWQPAPACGTSPPAPAPPAAGALGGDLDAVGSGLLKRWEVKGRPPWRLSCLQPPCVVSWTALLTAAGLTWKEAIASKPLAPKDSTVPQNRHLAQCPGKATGLLGCHRHQCPKCSEAGMVHHCCQESSPGVGSNKNAGSAWPRGEASRISLNRREKNAIEGANEGPSPTELCTVEVLCACSAT